MTQFVFISLEQLWNFLKIFQFSLYQSRESGTRVSEETLKADLFIHKSKTAPPSSFPETYRQYFFYFFSHIQFSWALRERCLRDRTDFQLLRGNAKREKQSHFRLISFCSLQLLTAICFEKSIFISAFARMAHFFFLFLFPSVEKLGGIGIDNPRNRVWQSEKEESKIRITWCHSTLSHFYRSLRFIICLFRNEGPHHFPLNLV